MSSETLYIFIDISANKRHMFKIYPNYISIYDASSIYFLST